MTLRSRGYNSGGDALRGDTRGTLVPSHPEHDG